MSARQFEPLFTSAEMRSVEEAYPGYPDSMRELMVRAGTSVAEIAMRRFPSAERYTVVCGGGSNGGDGLVAADVLRSRGCDVLVVSAKGKTTSNPGNPHVIIDALFGTGFTGEPRPDSARLIEEMNRAGVPIVSVDVASGVDASSGEVAELAVHATLTVTFQARKVGHVVAPGRFFCGELEITDIGLTGGKTDCRLATPALLELVPRKGAADTKFSAGSVLVVGGSAGLSGAVCLAAWGAYRADAGYVTVVAPRSVIPIVELQVLEAVKKPVMESADGQLTEECLRVIKQLESRAQALALGPGMGRSSETQSLVRKILAQSALPAVVDADALHGLEPGTWPAAVVLTPHAGELAQLLGNDTAWIDAHRLAAARECAQRFAAVTLLKGADTLIVSPTGDAIVCEEGTPALATAGSGDVLTGVLASFLAKGLRPDLAAAAAAVAHGRAARLIEPQAGIIASDIASALPRALG